MYTHTHKSIEEFIQKYLLWQYSSGAGNYLVSVQYWASAANIFYTVTHNLQAGCVIHSPGSDLSGSNVLFCFVSCFSGFSSSVFWPKVPSRVIHCPCFAVSSTPKHWSPIFWGFYYTNTSEKHRQTALENVSPLFVEFWSFKHLPGGVHLPIIWNRIPHPVLLQWAWALNPFPDPQVFCHIPKTEAHRSGNGPPVGM